MTEYIDYEPPASLAEKARRIAFSVASDSERLEDLTDVVLEMAKRLEKLENDNA